ncbi:protein FAM131A isoform X4 [Mastomys coucha]|uniref:protein FAM131A isoform X4 n=1 Tax=Mastomys coucha TaxID=35658 RepID=UPI001261F376|nr:protein FAM131A isoform X4 [Mastomys coucha]
MPMISVLGKMFLWQREGPGGRWTCQTSRRVASDPAWAVEWIELPRGLSLSSLGSARTLRGWSRSPRPSSVDSQDLPEVNVGDTVAMLPKSRRALTIQEIAALARSSLHGISQVVKDHVTKPTAMAQGRVAHLIEWKGWSKPSDSPAALESAFSSYSDLSEGEQEARFAAGVAEQFAIAEAKLRAWSSVDGDDSTDDSYDEDFTGGIDTDRRKKTIQADLDTPRTKITSYTQTWLGLWGPISRTSSQVVDSPDLCARALWSQRATVHRPCPQIPCALVCAAWRMGYWAPQPG